jgi:hypothetical protein
MRIGHFYLLMILINVRLISSQELGNRDPIFPDDSISKGCGTQVLEKDVLVL